jgi:hypothetical protein
LEVVVVLRLVAVLLRLPAMVMCLPTMVVCLPAMELCLLLMVVLPSMVSVTELLTVMEVSSAAIVLLDAMIFG